ncbi:hypothetical protein R2R35_18460 [Anaerocolumna sp. AGMB13020]|uniref:Mbov_0395 family pilin-like conjugal transfer protein n=1 Tax=Anaerocolumna sp. AGMB13020 TaxID=3081750 RepID=UPI002953629F|nr:hypothetical protein [Anaerocolumna sp. AGMB13020]WOO35764.1 hypothetical protein R2R35_18460 [Anaerocolumna sp. AGMB13020]
MKKLNNMKKVLKGMKSKVMYLLTLLFLLSNRVMIYAASTEGGNKITSSKAGSGLKNLLTDVSSFLLIISPIVGGLFAIYFFIRKNAADEQDQKQWNKRLVITGVSVIGAVLVSSGITLITGYFV